MKKIPTLFKKDPSDLGRVINEVHPDSAWVFEDHNVMATRKFDGTACAIIDGELYKRYDVKKGKSVPKGAIACQGPDKITGHWPHWIKCEREDPSNKYHFDAFDNMDSKYDGTYELCGPKIGGNPENFGNHILIRHGEDELTDCIGWSFEELKEYLTKKNIEGIVFHGDDNNKMCKIRKSDFGIKR